jgi:hypothetical protein
MTANQAVWFGRHGSGFTIACGHWTSSLVFPAVLVVRSLGRFLDLPRKKDK